MIHFMAAFAVWRATLLITEDEGPFSVFLWLRNHIDPHQKTWVGRGINCPWCVSFWAGLIASVWLWYFGFVLPELVPIWWFGLSGVSVLLSNLLTWMSRRR